MYKLNLIVPINQITSKDMKAISFAYETACESNFMVKDGKGPRCLGACIKKQKEYISAPNMKGQTRYGQESRLSLHAEMNALLGYLRKEYGRTSFKQKVTKINNYTIYVVRIMNGKKNLPEWQKCWFGCSKPCTNCQKNLHKFGFKKIKYTDIISGKNVLCEMIRV